MTGKADAPAQSVQPIDAETKRMLDALLQGDSNLLLMADSFSALARNSHNPAVDELKARLERRRQELLSLPTEKLRSMYRQHVASQEAAAQKAQADKAAKLAEAFGATYGGGLERLAELADYDILVNATSIGFGTEDSPVPAASLKRGVVVLDAVFVPTETALLKAAKERGGVVVPGYRMLIHQALFQFELFTGRKPPFEVMEQALLSVV